VDGQQRLTTVCLLLASVRDAAAVALRRDSEDPDACRAYQSLQADINGILFITLAGQSSRVKRRPRLTPSLEDRAPFLNAISPGRSEDNAGSAATSDDHISRAKRFLLDALVDSAKRLEVISAIRYFRGIFHGLADNCKILRFETKEEDLFCVYERLAFRAHMLRHMHNAAPGLQLAEADLVKNFVLSFFDDGEAVAVYNRLWIPMERIVVARTSTCMANHEEKKGTRSKDKLVDKVQPVGNRLDLLVQAFLANAKATESEKSTDDDGFQKPNAKHPPQNQGGAVHFCQDSFPTYIALRIFLEDILRKENVDITSVQPPTSSKEGKGAESAHGVAAAREKMAKKAGDIVQSVLEKLLEFAKADRRWHQEMIASKQ